jgi:PhnB protein
MHVQPYLFFDGRCEEAVAFYRSALGAEDKVMHTSFRIADTTVLASDGRCGGQSSFQGFSLSLTVADETEAERLFARLAEGGKVQMPLTNTFWSPRFGMVADRFGVSWMIVVAP